MVIIALSDVRKLPHKRPAMLFAVSLSIKCLRTLGGSKRLVEITMNRPRELVSKTRDDKHLRGTGVSALSDWRKRVNGDEIFKVLS